MTESSSASLSTPLVSSLYTGYPIPDQMDSLDILSRSDQRYVVLKTQHNRHQLVRGC